MFVSAAVFLQCRRHRHRHHHRRTCNLNNNNSNNNFCTTTCNFVTKLRSIDPLPAHSTTTRRRFGRQTDRRTKCIIRIQQSDAAALVRPPEQQWLFRPMMIMTHRVVSSSVTQLAAATITTIRNADAVRRRIYLFDMLQYTPVDLLFLPAGRPAGIRSDPSVRRTCVRQPVCVR